VILRRLQSSPSSESAFCLYLMGHWEANSKI